MANKFISIKNFYKIFLYNINKMILDQKLLLELC